MNHHQPHQNQPQPQSGHTFSAKEKDDETGYSYFGARYYDSDISVWLSVDLLSDKSPWVSPFSYCFNNPIIYNDPDGKFPLPIGYYVYMTTSFTLFMITASETSHAAVRLASGTSGNIPSEAKVPPSVRKQVKNAATMQDVKKVVNTTRKTIEYFAQAVASIPGLETAGDLTLTIYSLINGNDDDALAYATGLAIPFVSGTELKITKSAIHHIFTNKNFKAGQQWSKKFMPLFEKAGYTLEDAINKIEVVGHAGRHSNAYHNAVYARLTNAVAGKSGTAYKKAFDAEINSIRKDVIKEGTQLNKLLIDKN